MLGQDGYIYATVVRNANNTFNTVVARVDMFGQHIQVSQNFTTSRYYPGAPRAAAAFPGLVAVAAAPVLVSAGLVTRGEASVSYARVPVIDIVQPRLREGAVFLLLEVRGIADGVANRAVFDVLVERLRVAIGDAWAGEGGAFGVVRVFGNGVGSVEEAVGKEIEDVFRGTGATGKNVFERQFGLRKGKVRFGGLVRLEEGVVDDGVGASFGNGVGKKGGNGGGWVGIGAGIAGMAGVLVIAGGVFWGVRRRRGMEESFAESAIDGLPN